jgi:hypothetical protein
MATSGTTTYTTTASAIIKGALRLVGAISQGESPTAAQESEAMEALNMMTKGLAVKGLPLWRISNTQFNTVAGTATYNIGTGQTVNADKPLKMYQAFYSQGNVDVPLRIITRDEYERLGNKTSQGNPAQMYYEPLRDYGVIHLFPVPYATTPAITVIGQHHIEDFTLTTNTPDFPQEWFEALKYSLAARLAGEYGLNMLARSMLIREADRYMDEVLAFTQEEGSMYFIADRRF